MSVHLWQRSEVVPKHVHSDDEVVNFISTNLLPSSGHFLAAERKSASCNINLSTNPVFPVFAVNLAEKKKQEENFLSFSTIP